MNAYPDNDAKMAKKNPLFVGFFKKVDLFD
jgi:hypothetical protein